MSSASEIPEVKYFHGLQYVIPAPLTEDNREIKTFKDELLQGFKFPSLSKFEPAEDLVIKTLISNLYKYAHIPEASDLVCETIVALAYYELRDPKDHSKFIFAEYSDTKVAADSFPGGAYILEEKGLSSGLSFMASIWENLMGSDSTSKATNNNVNAKPADAANAGDTPDKATKYIEEKFSEFRSLAKTQNKEESTGGTVPGCLTREVFTLKERAYIGAWALYHMRCMMKNAVSMIGMQSKGGPSGKNRMHDLISKLYSINLSDNFLVPLSDKAYSCIHDNMSRNNNDCKAYLLRSFTVDLYCSDHAQEGKAISSTLRGLFLQTATSNGLPTYNWLKKVSVLTKIPPQRILTQTMDTRLWGTTAMNVNNFILRYTIDKSSYDHYVHSNPGTPVVPYIGGKYWPIARKIDDAYLTEVGRKGNENYILFLTELTRLLEPTDSIVNAQISVKRNHTAIVNKAAYYYEYLQDSEVGYVAEEIKPKATTVAKPELSSRRNLHENYSDDEI